MVIITFRVTDNDTIVKYEGIDEKSKCMIKAIINYSDGMRKSFYYC